MRGVLIFAFLFFSPVFSFATPPLVEKIEQETGLDMTINQKEELSSFSQKKHEDLKDAGEILVKQLSQILSIPEKSLRLELFPDIGIPHAELNPATGAKLEKLLGREMTKTEYELVDMAFKAFKEKERAITGEYAAQIANLVDLPQDTVQELISR